MNVENDSNQSDNGLKKKPELQPKQTLETAALGYLKAKAWVKKQKGLVISTAKMIAQIKDVEFNAFIEEAKESGGFIRLEQLDKAAESGLIDKTELQDYKNFFENENRAWSQSGNGQKKKSSRSRRKLQC